jgi:O-antigen/teichoic acid export membrane protein
MSKPSSSFAGNVLKLVTGSVFAQGLGILAAPIVTRLFAPEAFGVAALFVSITGIMGAVACLRYELAIMLPKTDEEAANLLGVSLCFVIIITGISALIIFLVDDVVVQLLNSPELKKYLWLVPIAIFFNGIFLALNYWNSRTKHFGRLSIAGIVSAVIAQATKLGAGFAGYISSGVLIATGILGSIVSTFVLGGQIWRDDRHLFKASIRCKKMIEGLKRHKRFPAFTVWATILNAVSRQSSILLLAYFFSPQVVGFFAIGQRIVNLPSTLIGQKVGQVFFQKATEAKYEGKLGNVVEEVFHRLVSLGTFPILLLGIIGREFFIVAFGTRWAEAGVYVQILALWTFFAFIYSPVSTLFPVLEKQGVNLIFNSLLFFVRVLSLVLGGLTSSARITLFLYSAANLVIIVWMCFWILSKVGIPSKRTLRYISKYILYSAPILAVIAISKWGLGLRPWVTLVISCFGTILYYITIFKQDKLLQEIIIQGIFKRVGLVK